MKSDIYSYKHYKLNGKKEEKQLCDMYIDS